MIELEELRERRLAIERRRAELQEAIRTTQEALKMKERRRSLDEAVASFTRNLEATLEEVTFEEKRQILQLVVEQVSVDQAGRVEIHYVMPVSGNLRLQLGRPDPPGLTRERHEPLLAALLATEAHETEVRIAAAKKSFELLPNPLLGRPVGLEEPLVPRAEQLLEVIFHDLLELIGA